MKKVVLTLLILLLPTSIVAAATSLGERVKTTEIVVEIQVSALPLEDFLAFLSLESGIQILAAPEVAGREINLQLPAHQTLAQVFEALQKGYHLRFQVNEKQTAVIVLKGPVYETSFLNVPGGIRKAMPWARAEVTGPPPMVSMMPSYRTGTAYNTEEYKRIADNRFQDVLTTALSTFSIDVDTASYSNIRRFINSGKLPPADAVRTEELLNYFHYDYQQPTEAQPFSLTTELGDCPWQPGHQLVLIGLQGKDIATEAIPPGNLVFLIDVSGSMDQENKLPLLKTAFKLLVAKLRSQDKVSIVIYASRSGMVLPPTSGSEKEKILQTLDSLHAAGSTAGGEGIQLAYKIAKENFIPFGNNRVILATDGDFNVGVSSEGELTQLIEERRKDGIFLSILGFGMGNIKDNKMETLADAGNGNYAYIDNALEAKKVMVGEMAGTLYTIAKDVKLQVEFNPAKVKSYRLIGYENRSLANSDFKNDAKDAGDMGAGHSVTALYEIIPAGSTEIAGTTDQLIYQRPQIVPSEELLHVKIRYKQPQAESSQLMEKRIHATNLIDAPSDNFRFATAVAEYGMLLRKSEFMGQATYQQAIELARGAKGNDIEGYRAECIRLMEISQLLEI